VSVCATDPELRRGGACGGRRLRRAAAACELLRPHAGVRLSVLDFAQDFARVCVGVLAVWCCGQQTMLNAGVGSGIEGKKDFPRLAGGRRASPRQPTAAQPLVHHRSSALRKKNVFQYTQHEHTQRRTARGFSHSMLCGVRHLGSPRPTQIRQAPPTAATAATTRNQRRTHIEEGKSPTTHAAPGCCVAHSRQHPLTPLLSARALAPATVNGATKKSSAKMRNTIADLPAAVANPCISPCGPAGNFRTAVAPVSAIFAPFHRRIFFGVAEGQGPNTGAREGAAWRTEGAGFY
jgi:hypothetical protein